MDKSRERIGGRRRRWRAARHFRPDHVRLLLVAKAPPAPKPGEEERYFYFPVVRTHDDLFLEVTRALLGSKPDRGEKVDALGQLQQAGVFLIDLKLDPDDGTALDPHVSTLVGRCRRIQPDHVVLISTPVYDAAYRRLAAAAIPVIAERIDFPGSGKQKEFRRKFGRAIAAIGWSTMGTSP